MTYISAAKLVARRLNDTSHWSIAEVANELSRLVETLRERRAL
jgi:hypothetical protein